MREYYWFRNKKLSSNHRFHVVYPCDVQRKLCVDWRCLCLIAFCLSGLQGGVGESDPGAAVQRQQPHRTAGPQTDRRLLHGQHRGWLQHFPSQWVLAVLWIVAPGSQTPGFSRTSALFHNKALFETRKKTAPVLKGRRSISKHELMFLDNPTLDSGRASNIPLILWALLLPIRTKECTSIVAMAAKDNNAVQPAPFEDFQAWIGVEQRIEAQTEVQSSDVSQMVEMLHPTRSRF